MAETRRDDSAPLPPPSTPRPVAGYSEAGAIPAFSASPAVASTTSYRAIAGSSRSRRTLQRSSISDGPTASNNPIHFSPVSYAPHSQKHKYLWHWAPDDDVTSVEAASETASLDLVHDSGPDENITHQRRRTDGDFTSVTFHQIGSSPDDWHRRWRSHSVWEIEPSSRESILPPTTGIGQQDFAYHGSPDAQRPLQQVFQLNEDWDFHRNIGDIRHSSTWTVRLDRNRRKLSTASLPLSIGRRLSSALDAIPVHVRRLSNITNLIEGVFNPTAVEIAKHYSTPSIGAFDLDLEKGAGVPDAPVNPARSLTKRELLHQRLMFASLVAGFNVACVTASAVGDSGVWVLVIILFFKSKDFLCVWIQVLCCLYYRIKALRGLTPVGKKSSWILSLIPAYSESEEQIVKALFSLRDNGMGDHQQVMCVILDGKPRPIKSHMTKVVASFQRKYVSLKWKIGTLQVDAGFVDDIPTLCIEKTPNAGKKDSLVLCHDLFNYPRSNMDPGTQSLREELWNDVIPQLTGRKDFKSFDLVFCTDADSTIHQGALASLADACLADPKAIAACGFVFVEFEPGLEWSIWNLYQQFQYCFGQIVRRGAEHFIGKVTCLPGCITMVVVRPEMAGAIEKYAKPVTTYPVLRHQVQYLGTDRRLTYAMLSQGKHLHTLFVPEAGSETVAPQSLKHYLSQRRRWGSNAFFNNFFYCAGENMILITRIAASIEITRLLMVYYRVFNTALFLYGVATNFSLISILPLILVSFTPSLWFAFAVAFLNPHLRRNWKKLLCGFCINRCISPFMSITVFSLVAKNLGSQVWGISGVTAGTNVASAEVVAAQVSEQPLGEELMVMEEFPPAPSLEELVQRKGANLAEVGEW